MNLRLTESHYMHLRRLSSPSFDGQELYAEETGCILLVGHNQHPERESLLVAEVLEPISGELSDQARGGLTFSSSYLRRALLRVRERELAGFITVHTHPHSDNYVRFSKYDDDQDPQLMRNLYELQPNGMFGSMVLGKRSMAARVWLPGEQMNHHMLDECVVVGERLVYLPLTGVPAPEPPSASEIFDRGTVLTGTGALARLSRMTVGVVGTSGTGSLMVELLARAGAGELVLFEFDLLEEVNLNRILHSRVQDAQQRRNKAQRLAEALEASGLPTRVRVMPIGDITCSEAAQELRQCEILFGCVDRDWPRLILSQMANQYLLPFIDLGTEIGVGNGVIQSVDSRVSYVAPNRPCLLCSGIITTEQLRLEGLEPEERARVLAMGYSHDVQLRAPAVMDLNMRAASMAMLLTRHLLQPFLDRPLPTHVKETVTNFRCKPIRLAADPDCLICSPKARQGLGDALPLSTRM